MYCMSSHGLLRGLVRVSSISVEQNETRTRVGLHRRNNIFICYLLIRAVCFSINDIHGKIWILSVFYDTVEFALFTWHVFDNVYLIQMYCWLLNMTDYMFSAPKLFRHYVLWVKVLVQLKFSCFIEIIYFRVLSRSICTCGHRSMSAATCGWWWSQRLTKNNIFSFTHYYITFR